MKAGGKARHGSGVEHVMIHWLISAIAADEQGGDIPVCRVDLVRNQQAKRLCQHA